MSNADAIVILSGGLEVDNALPQNVKNRVALGVTLFHQGVAPRIILSGRCSLRFEGEPAVTEAQAMRLYAVELGMPEDAILLEEQSCDTIGNAYFIKKLYLDKFSWRSIRIVTSDFHTPRAYWIFSKILGSAYDFSISAAESSGDDKVYLEHSRNEVLERALLRRWLQPVDPAYPDTIENFIRTNHPGYAKNSVTTKEQLALDKEEIDRALGSLYPAR